MKEKDWKKQLFERLSHYEETAPEGLWADIEARLGAQMPQKHQSARTIPLWVKLAAAAAFAGVLTGNGYLMWMIGCEGSVDGEGSREIAESVMITSKQDPAKVQESTAELAKKSDPMDVLLAQSAGVPQRILQVSDRQIKLESQEDLNVSADPLRPVYVIQDNPVIPEKLEGQTLPEDRFTAQTSTQPLEETIKTDESVSKIKENARESEEVMRELDRQIAQSVNLQHGYAEFCLYTSNGFGDQSNSNGVLMNPMLMDSYNCSKYMSRPNSVYDDPVFLVNYEERQKHHQPISFGLTVNFPISSRIYMVTGLVYTRLRSDFSNMADHVLYKKEQTLYDIGIPVMGQFYAKNRGRLRAYVAIGGQADFNVKTRLIADGVEQELRKDRVQWSANTALGLQYHILPQFAVYAEPGLKYYFDNGSGISTFFKDRPMNFNLQVGLRLALEGDRLKN